MIQYSFLGRTCLRMGTELGPETLYSNELTRLCAREDDIDSTITVQIYLSCFLDTFPRVPRQSSGMYPIVGCAFPFPIDISVLCYQPYCYNCFQNAAIFKFVAAKVLLQRWKNF